MKIRLLAFLPFFIFLTEGRWSEPEKHAGQLMALMPFSDLENGTSSNNNQTSSTSPTTVPFSDLVNGTSSNNNQTSSTSPTTVPFSDLVNGTSSNNNQTSSTSPTTVNTNSTANSTTSSPPAIANSLPSTTSANTTTQLPSGVSHCSVRGSTFVWKTAKRHENIIFADDGTIALSGCKIGFCGWAQGDRDSSGKSNLTVRVNDENWLISILDGACRSFEGYRVKPNDHEGVTIKLYVEEDLNYVSTTELMSSIPSLPTYAEVLFIVLMIFSLMISSLFLCFNPSTDSICDFECSTPSFMSGFMWCAFSLQIIGIVLVLSGRTSQFALVSYIGIGMGLGAGFLQCCVFTIIMMGHNKIDMMAK